MASNYSVVFATSGIAEKVVYLPSVSSVPGRILYVKDICGSSQASTIFLSTSAGDMIDYHQNTVYAKLDSFSGLIKLASNGSNNWMVLSHYTDALGAPPPPTPPPPPPAPWASIRDGDGSVTDYGGGSWHLTGANDGGGNGWSYIVKQFSSAGSFTFSFYYTCDDTPGYDWAFQNISSADLTNPANVNFYSDRFGFYSGTSGTHTATYGANDWVAIGLFASDSCCGRAYLSLSGIPT